MKSLIDIIKFKITIFTAILGGAGFLAVNSKTIEKTLANIEIINFIIWSAIFIIITYGVIGFLINMNKLSELEKRIQDV